MPYTLQGALLQTATVRIPRFGAWTADVAIAGGLELAAGARVTLAVGDLSLVGSVVSGGTFGGQSTYSLIGGAGRWNSTIPAKGHRSDLGITVAEVARDLATDAGELGVILEAGVERPLGYAWERRAGLASDALEVLVGDAWWTAPDGWTHIGPRPVRPIAPASLTVERYDPATRRATVSLADDAVAQLLPGAVLTAQGLPAPLQVGQAVLRVEASSVVVDLVGERPASELLAAIQKMLQGRLLLAAPQLYQVTEDAQQRTTARPAGPAAAALPDQAGIDRVFGLPGARADLAAGELVVVALLDGSPGSPRVVGFLPGVLPLVVGLDAQQVIEIGTHGSTHKLARADRTNGILQGLALAIKDMGGPDVPTPDVSTTKLEGE